MVVNSAARDGIIGMFGLFVADAEGSVIGKLVLALVILSLLLVGHLRAELSCK